MDVLDVSRAPVNRRGGQTSYLLLRKGQFDSDQLAITWVDCEPGSQQELHSHAAEEQAYVIVRGSGVMIAGEEEQEVKAGTLVYIPPGTPHAIRNDSSEPLTYVSATSPPFDPESLSDVFRYGPT